jgi:hypothetical protein
MSHTRAMLAGRGRLSFQLVRETWVGCAVVFRLAFFAAFADPRRRASLRSLRSMQFFDMPVTAPKYTA